MREVSVCVREVYVHDKGVSVCQRGVRVSVCE